MEHELSNRIPEEFTEFLPNLTVCGRTVRSDAGPAPSPERDQQYALLNVAQYNANQWRDFVSHDSRRSKSQSVTRFVALGIAVLTSALVIWLIAPSANQHPSHQTGLSPSSDFALTSIASEWDIEFLHDPGPASFFFPAITGSGVALFDFDQDGDLDIFAVNGTGGAPHPLARPDTVQSRNRLYRQDPGPRFVDVTESSGVGYNEFGMGAAVGDVNNDGYPDLFLVNFGCDRLFLNRRDGTFVDITTGAGLTDSLWGSSAAFVDFDRDGRLDLFVVNYVDYSRPKACKKASGIEDFCLPLHFPPAPDRLYRNVTDPSASRLNPAAVRFEDASEASGIATKPGRGLGIRPGDFNDDGWPDLFVANDSEENTLWVNRRDGTFRDLAVPWGVALDRGGRPQASMGIAEGDVDLDGRDDLVVTGLRGEYTIVYRRRSTDGYDDVSHDIGVASTTRPFTGFGAALVDLDHDTDLDLIIVNGRVVQLEGRPVVAPPANPYRDAAGSERFWSAYAEPQLLLENDGAGRYRNVTGRSGDFAQVVQSSRALAVGDLDNDGDLDLVVTNVAGPLNVFRNDATKVGHWLMVRAVDPFLGGRDAYGARVTVYMSSRQLTRCIQPASSYQSSDDPRAHFGLGPASRVEYIEVVWPNGERERFAGCDADRHVTLGRGKGVRH
jgi:hypothetical protein